MAIYLSNAWKIENVKDSEFDPYDNRSGPKPRDGGHKPMHISFNAKNRKALAKIKDEIGMSQFLNRILDPISETMDPGPASPILLEFWNGLADKMANLVKEGELDTATTIGHVLVDIKPIVQPYLDLCEEDEETDIAKDNILNIDTISVNNYDEHTLESVTYDDVSDMINDVLVVRLSEQLYHLLQIAQLILQKIPSQYKTRWHSEGTDELSTKTRVTEKILKKYGAEILPQENSKDDNVNSDSIHDFRKDLPIFDILKQCKEIKQKAKGIQNQSIRKFVSQSCELVQDMVTKAAGAGIDMNLEEYRWHEKTHSYFVDLFNCGKYDIDVLEVWCDGKQCSMHAWYAGGNKSHLPAGNASQIQFFPASQVTGTSKHNITIKTLYKEFSFLIQGKKTVYFASNFGK